MLFLAQVLNIPAHVPGEIHKLNLVICLEPVHSIRMAQVLTASQVNIMHAVEVPHQRLTHYPVGFNCNASTVKKIPEQIPALMFYDLHIRPPCRLFFLVYQSRAIVTTKAATERGFVLLLKDITSGILQQR